MKYLLLIYGNEKDFGALSDAEKGKIFEEYMDYSKRIKKAGHYISGEALQAISTATTVRVKNGKTLVTDGPFAEAKEQLGGYLIVDCASPERATEIAALWPNASLCAMEVRPIMQEAGTEM